MRAAPTSLLVAALLVAPTRALAYEDQAGISLGGGYAAIASDNPYPNDHGLVLQLEGAIGLGDTWELRALASWAIHVGDEPLHRVTGGLELVYLVDILEVVPFLGVGLDLPTSICSPHLGADGITSLCGRGSVWVDFAAHGVVGVDWLVSREWALGVEVRPYVFLTALSDDPVWITAIIRAQLLFEI